MPFLIVGKQWTVADSTSPLHLVGGTRGAGQKPAPRVRRKSTHPLVVGRGITESAASYRFRSLGTTT